MSCCSRPASSSISHPLTQLDSRALILGLSWLGVGIIYLLVLTRGLTRKPPEMDISEAG